MIGTTLITPTGGRQESFARCARYVARFKNNARLPVQWIVVDDSDQQSHAQFRGAAVHYIRPSHVWKPGMNTLSLNLLAAIPSVLYDTVMFIEDDDWYSPDYMRLQSERLRGADITGESMTRYYHLQTSRYAVIEGMPHASLCQTAMRSEYLPVLKNVCESSADYIDVRLWRAMIGKRAVKSHLPHCVGMKGLPGRPGIGAGHTPSSNLGWKHDNNREKLHEWLGNDAVVYLTQETSLKTLPDRA